MTIKVLSYQQSGVAWVPGRIKALLEGWGSGAVEMECVGTAEHESYDLAPTMPVEKVSRNLPAWQAAKDRGAQVLHLHHDRCAAPEMARFPPRERAGIKVVCTVHGEPDRSRGRLTAPVDLFHCVQPDLMALPRGDVPAKLLPNHPARGLADCDPKPLDQREKVLLVPFSHVRRFKSHRILESAEPRLKARGWTIDRLRWQTNAELVKRLRSARACWVQLLGYVDILTMECWSVGCVPVVVATGGKPEVTVSPFDGLDGPGIARALEDTATMQTFADCGRATMRCNWTETRVAHEWERLYAGLLQTAAEK